MKMKIFESINVTCSCNSLDLVSVTITEITSMNRRNGNKAGGNNGGFISSPGRALVVLLEGGRCFLEPAGEKHRNQPQRQWNTQPAKRSPDAGKHEAKPIRSVRFAEVVATTHT